MAGLIFVAALSWVVAVLIFRGIVEPTNEGDKEEPNKTWWQNTWRLFVEDKNVGLIVLFLLVTSVHWLSTSANAWILPLGFFAMSVVHAGVRMARSTYVVDMVEGDKRTEYVGGANTIMGVVLLIIGALSDVIASFGPAEALILLALMGLVGVAMSSRLKEVSASHKAVL